MNSKKRRLSNFKLYAITDLQAEDPQILKRIEGALRGGVDIVQLRSRHLSDRALFDLGKRIRVLTEQLKKLFIVNDRADLALAIDADGVHLGQEDLAIKFARKMMRDKIIGCSTHTLKQALAAERAGADYIGFGPIFDTPTKPTYRAVGLEPIGEVVNRIQIPVVCIGGIDPSNVKKVIGVGANRIAVVRAIFSAADPYEAARSLKSEMI